MGRGGGIEQWVYMEEKGKSVVFHGIGRLFVKFEVKLFVRVKTVLLFLAFRREREREREREGIVILQSLLLLFFYAIGVIV